MDEIVSRSLRVSGVLGMADTMVDQESIGYNVTIKAISRTSLPGPHVTFYLCATCMSSENFKYMF